MPELVRTSPNGQHMAHTTPLKHIMSSEITCAAPDLDLPALVERMLRERLGCIPVVDRHRRPIGIITKRDLVDLVGAQLLDSAPGERSDDLRTRTADELMMPMPVTLSESSSVADAAMLMAKEGFHHVLVVSEDGRLCGVLTSHDIVTWLADEDVVASAARQML